MIQIGQELRTWRGAVRHRLDPKRPPLLGWQVPLIGCGVQIGRHGPGWLLDQVKRRGFPLTLYVMGKEITFGGDPEYARFFYSAGTEEVSFFEGIKVFPGVGDLVEIGLTGPEGSTLTLEVLRRHLGARISSVGAELDQELSVALREGLASGRAPLLGVLRTAILRLTAHLLLGPDLARDRTFIADLCDFDEATLACLRAPWSRRPVARGLAARGRAVARMRAELEGRGPPTSDPPRDIGDAMRSAAAAAAEAGGPRLSDEIIARDLQGILFGTVANTPAAAAITLHRVLTDPALKRRLEEEQAAVSRERGPTIDAAALKAMPVLNATYLEGLRVYAPMIHIRMTLTPVEIGGYRVPARSLIGFSPYILHRDPAVYEDPEVFDPDRFLAGPRRPAAAPPNSHFVPYGRGIHTCLGRNLARQEIMMSIARLLRDYEVELSDPSPTVADWLTNGIAAPAGAPSLIARPRGASLG